MTDLAEHKIVRAGIGRKFQTPSIYENLTVFKNLEVSFRAAHGVFGALAFRAPTRSRRASRRWPNRDRPRRPLEIEAGLLSATARSSGSRSACCSCRTRSC
jgi:urea transport system ATP-binding protein